MVNNDLIAVATLNIVQLQDRVVAKFAHRKVNYLPLTVLIETNSHLVTHCSDKISACIDADQVFLRLTVLIALEKRYNRRHLILAGRPINKFEVLHERHY